MSSSMTFWGWGWVGVDLFFVLSGFLITGILFDSLQRKDYFRNFYTRRVLRVFPLFYAVWLVLVLLTPVLHIMWTRYNLLEALYLGNMFQPGALAGLHTLPGDVAYRSFAHRGEIRQIALTPMWSLCVEEQFYLVWPLLIWLVKSQKVLLRICLAVIVVVPIARTVYLHLHPNMLMVGAVYYNSWSRIDTLMMGSALALWLRGSCVSIRFIQKSALLSIVGGLVVFIALMQVFHQWNPDTRQNWVSGTIGFSLIGIVGCGILLLAVDTTSVVSRVLQNRPMTFLGRISYGMYLLHGIPAGWFDGRKDFFAAHHVLFTIPLLAMVWTVVAATLSFRFLEAPFLRLKERFAPRPGAADEPPPETVNIDVFFAA